MKPPCGTEFTCTLVGPYVIAVDFAAYGKDFTGICVMRYNDDGTMQLIESEAGEFTAAQIARHIRRWRWKARWLAVWNFIRGCW